MSCLETLINEGNQMITESNHNLEINYDIATEDLRGFVNKMYDRKVNKAKVTVLMDSFKNLKSESIVKKAVDAMKPMLVSGPEAVKVIKNEVSEMQEIDGPKENYEGKLSSHDCIVKTISGIPVAYIPNDVESKTGLAWFMAPIKDRKGNIQGEVYSIRRVCEYILNPIKEDSANEGFFIDDKNPNIKTEENDNKSASWIGYKGKGAFLIGSDWVNVYISMWDKTTEPFVKSGKSFVSKCVSDIEEGKRYCEANRKKFIEAYNNKNTEVMNNIADGMRNIFTTSIAASRQANAGGRQFAGPITDMPDSLKNSLKPELTKFAKIYRETGLALAKKKIIDVRSKSTLKKIFNINNYTKKYGIETYLDYELFLYCQDLHIEMDSARFTK